MGNSHAVASSSEHYHHHHPHQHAHHDHDSNDGRIYSSSSSSASGGTIAHALRLFRVQVHLLAAPSFLHSKYVWLGVLKGPERTLLPASVNFRRGTLFLTFLVNFHWTWYFCLCRLHSILSLGGGRRRAGGSVRRRSYATRVVVLYSNRPTAFMFPLASFFGFAYYLILHYHPLNRLRVQLVSDHGEKMALLHFKPLLFIFLDSWLKDAELVAYEETSGGRINKEKDNRNGNAIDEEGERKTDAVAEEDWEPFEEPVELSDLDEDDTAKYISTEEDSKRKEELWMETHNDHLENQSQMEQLKWETYAEFRIATADANVYC